MEILLSLAIALIVGLLLSRLAKVLKLPAVTAYLVAGILVGPFCLGQAGVKGLDSPRLMKSSPYQSYQKLHWASSHFQSATSLDCPT